MKPSLLLVCAIALSLGLVGCGDSADQGDIEPCADASVINEPEDGRPTIKCVVLRPNEVVQGETSDFRAYIVVENMETEITSVSIDIPIDHSEYSHRGVGGEEFQVIRSTDTLQTLMISDVDLDWWLDNLMPKEYAVSAEVHYRVPDDYQEGRSSLTHLHIRNNEMAVLSVRSRR